LPLTPVGFFTTTENIQNLVVGESYTLMSSDITYGPGNWGWVNFNGNGGSANVLNAWLDCGFDPASTSSTWPAWCPSYSNAHGEGPVEHYQCADHPDCTSPGALIRVPYLKWGLGDEGWWLNGSTGTKNSDCQDLVADVQENQEYYIPI